MHNSFGGIILNIRWFVWFALRKFCSTVVKAVQELSKQNDSLQNQTNELKEIVLKSNPSTSSTAFISTKLTDASLEQNAPNPFSHTTTIRFSLPKKFGAAQIIITDMQGRTLNQINISGSGKGVVNIDTAMLSGGTYNYSLVIDGKNISTRQMILTK